MIKKKINIKRKEKEKKVKDFKFSKSKKSIDSIVSHRIVILSLIIFAVFITIFLRLLYLQVYSHDEYVSKKEDYTSIHQFTSAPRGQIYDCKGRVLAKTVVSHNIVYTSPNNMSIDDYLIYAKRLASVFNVKIDDFSLRDKQEAYITWKSFLDYNDPEYGARHLLTKKEREEYASGAWGAGAETTLYSKLISRIGDEEIKEMSKEELKTCVIYQRMIANISLGQESVILEDVSDDDVAYLVEHKTEFPGFEVDFGGWKREYPYGETLIDVLGKVSTNTEGLPAEYIDHYLSKGYQLNAPVGKSGLELQYNDILSGTDEISKITYNSEGLAIKEVVQDAKKGNDIVLSIDIDLQKEMDSVVKNVLAANAGTPNRENFSSLFMNILNPNDGSVLALSGYQMDLETREMTYFASGNYVSLANPGSCVKGATVYMGLSEGVIAPGEVIVDEVMNINGQEFASFENHGPVDDIKALQVSSNVYMFHIAIRMGGGEYKENEPLNIVDVPDKLDDMRAYYSMFGLGNKTGIDAPGEVEGYMGASNNPGMLLNYAIGQMDMYSPIQMSLYASVVANSGKLYTPHFYDYSKEINGDQIFDVYNSKAINTLPEENSEYLKRVQEGFRACVSEGYCGIGLENLGVPIAAKTGTAEVTEWTTANLIGYGPYDNPTMAFACMSPTSSVNSEHVSPNICSTEVVPPVLKKYFELYPPK